MAKKLAVIDTIEKAFSMFFERPGYILIYLLPLAVMGIMMLHLGLWLFMPAFAGAAPAAPYFMPSFIATIIIYIVAMVVVGTIANAALILRVDAQRRGRKMGVTDSLRKGLEKFPKLFLASLAVAAITIAGSIAFIIPGIYLAVRLMLFAPACVLDGNYGLKRSWKATAGNFWRVLALMVLLAVISMIISIIPIVGLLVTMLIIGPIVQIAYTLAYIRLR